MPVRDIYAGHWSVTGAGAPDADSPDEAVYLPGRNALLLIKAAIWCQLHGVRRLALAPLGTSPFADASADFVQRFQSVVNCGTLHELQIVLPFAEMNKRQVMEVGRAYPLEHTFSCIAPVQDLHCGRCNKCAERRQAFRLAEMDDPTEYAASSVPIGSAAQ
jgi:7-cyano-7-deazaguanine synthase